MIKPFSPEIPTTPKGREAGFIKAAFWNSLPLAVCLLLLLAIGYMYISTFEKGPVYSFCYIVLPVLIGVFSTVFFAKKTSVGKLSAAAVKERCIFLGFFAAHILVLSLVEPNKPSPELLILYIPVAYALYVSIMPYKGIIKPIICGIFWIGTAILSMLRPTIYAGDGVFVIQFSLFMVSVSAVRKGAFGFDSKWKKYVVITAIFTASCLIIPFNSIIGAPSDVVSITSPTDVIQNIGAVPFLLLCALCIAVVVCTFLVATCKAEIMAYITIAAASSFALILGYNILSTANIISATRFGLPFLESTELTTCFGILLTSITCSPNGGSLSEHAFWDSLVFDSPYKGIFCSEKFGAKLFLLQGATGSGKTTYINNVIIASEPGFSLYFSMETAYDRFIQAIRNCGLSPARISPVIVFPEITQQEVALLIIDDIDSCLEGRPATQAEFANLITSLLEDYNISVIVSGTNLAKKIPILWQKLTDKNKEARYSIRYDNL